MRLSLNVCTCTSAGPIFQRAQLVHWKIDFMSVYKLLFNATRKMKNLPKKLISYRDSFFFDPHSLSLSLDVKSLFRILFHYYFIDSTRSFKGFHLLFHSIQQFRISRPDYGWFPNIIHSLQWCDARLATINEMKRQKRMRFPTPPRLTIPITIQNVPSKYETKMEVPIFVESIKHIIEITVSWN